MKVDRKLGALIFAAAAAVSGAVGYHAGSSQGEHLGRLSGVNAATDAVIRGPMLRCQTNMTTPYCQGVVDAALAAANSKGGAR